MKIAKIILLLIVFSISSQIVMGQSKEEPTTWGDALKGTDPTLLYLPDAKATYWRYAWDRDSDDVNGIVITGEFPEARYFSYNVYDENTKNSLGSFTDCELTPEGGKKNPFAGNISISKDESYVIYILPEGSTFKADNILYFPKSVEKVSVLLRHYLPSGNIYGNKPMPQIKIINTEDKKITKAAPSLPVPKLTKQQFHDYLIPLFKKLGKEYENNPEAVIEKLTHRDPQNSLKLDEIICKQLTSGAFEYFYKDDPTLLAYNLNPAGTYPNHDNYYLTMPVIRENDSDALLIKFKPSDYPKSPLYYPNSPIRYYSISQGDDLTYNYATLYDEEFSINDDGFVYLLIGNDSKELREKVKSLGVNFMPWLVKEKMMLVYRNMKPKKGYKHSTNNVATPDKSKSGHGQEGNVFIGDYSPIGIMIPTKDILSAKVLPKF